MPLRLHPQAKRRPLAQGISPHPSLRKALGDAGDVREDALALDVFEVLVEEQHAGAPLLLVGGGPHAAQLAHVLGHLADDHHLFFFSRKEKKMKGKKVGG
jgi:hypothetical protein